jgi:hypothetical protein
MGTVSRFIRGSRIADNAQAARVISNVIDFSLLNGAAADVVQAFKLDAGTVVLTVGVKVLTAQGATCTCTVGDASAVDTYLTGVDLNATATDVGDALAAPVYQKAESYINLVLGHTTSVAKVYVWALVANVHGNVE